MGHDRFFDKAHTIMGDVIQFPTDRIVRRRTETHSAEIVRLKRENATMLQYLGKLAADFAEHPTLQCVVITRTEFNKVVPQSGGPQ